MVREAGKERAMTKWIRLCLLLIEGFVALTALAGGITLIVAALMNVGAGVVAPDISYLDGSPFHSYLVPGILLTGLIGGTQSIALALVAQRNANALVATIVAALGLNIWVFVELVYIPFSFLQVIYFAASLGEIGLATLGLGLLRFRVSPRFGLRGRAARSSAARREATRGSDTPHTPAR
jgi:hypothetical protein